MVDGDTNPSRFIRGPAEGPQRGFGDPIFAGAAADAAVPSLPDSIHRMISGDPRGPKALPIDWQGRAATKTAQRRTQAAERSPK